uniref:NADH-ubiquinone oxidoreductase chain 5 n=1 Tax=Prostomis sp. PRO01 TaxID=1205644 RepID=A0A0S2MQ41_9CUCU|nr:NADH deshydrogenase subunit 5 [Prostomis sp. PRO01]
MMNICKIYFKFFFFFSILFFFVGMYLMSLSYVIFFELGLININSSCIMMTVLVDWMSMLFLSFVLFISSMVIFYSNEYMEGDIYLNRFIMLVVMFVVSMMLLIISPNLISILLGWDGLGLVSYCLVIYYQNVKSYNAGMLTALTNRVGDVALLMGIAWMLNYGSWNYIFYLEELKNDKSMIIITFLVVLASLTKSAQIPFSSWLPAAMAAPTPVSSLVHSSTLVTAGVYLLIRFNYSFNNEMMFVLLFISSLTMFMSGLGASFEFDLKKIIALSTLSQLGLMMSVLFLGGWGLAFYHLLIHALFKALLFMCAGNVIHNLNNCQDIRYMGSFVQLMPLTCAFFNISNLSLCGLPFLSGFYSKDMIAEVMSMDYLNFYIYFIFYVSIGLTVCYSFRLVYYSCVGDMNFISLNSLTENNFFMMKGMMGLIFLFIFMGSAMSWMIFSSLYVIILPLSLKLMTLFVIMIGIILGLIMSKFYLHYSNLSHQLLSFSWFFSSMWYLPYISTLSVNLYPIKTGKIYFNKLDQGWGEFYGSSMVGNLLTKNSKYLQIVLDNNIKVFFILLIVWLFLIFFI